MFSFFKKARTEVSDVSDADKETSPTKMSLEERKAWRANMLCKSIQEVFTSLGITPKMYKYRITAIDDRGHYYAVMIETLRIFSLTEYTTTKKLLDIAIILKTRTFDSYGIVVDGVYWKTDESIDLFDSTNTLRHPSVKHKKTIHDLRDMVLSDNSNEPRSAPEHSFTRDTFDVDGKTYDTDIMPIADDDYLKDKY